MPKEDYLTEDSILPSGQQWVCISFFSKNHVKQSIENNNDYKKDADKETYDIKNNVMGVKVRGAFETYEEACNQAKTIRDIDAYHNVYVAEMGKWCAFILEESDNDKYVKQTEYANEELNDMMKKYVDNQEKSKVYHELRKNDLLKQSIDENLESRNLTKEETLKLLSEAETKEEKKTLKDKLIAIDDQIAKMEEKKKEIQTKEEELSNVINK